MNKQVQCFCVHCDFERRIQAFQADGYEPVTYTSPELGGWEMEAKDVNFTMELLSTVGKHERSFELH